VVEALRLGRAVVVAGIRTRELETDVVIYQRFQALDNDLAEIIVPFLDCLADAAVLGVVAGPLENKSKNLAVSARETLRPFGREERNLLAALRLLHHLHALRPEQLDDVLGWFVYVLQLQPFTEHLLDDLGKFDLGRVEARGIHDNLAVESARRQRELADSACFLDINISVDFKVFRKFQNNSKKILNQQGMLHSRAL
jgi:hypothetical protein